MIIVDRALEKRQREGNPVRVTMVGAGFMGRVLALQIVQATPGMELVAISNRNPSRGPLPRRGGRTDRRPPG